MTVMHADHYAKESLICNLEKTKLLKGTPTLMVTRFYMKDLNKPWFSVPVSYKSVGKRRSLWHLNICNWTLMEAVIL